MDENNVSERTFENSDTQRIFLKKDQLLCLEGDQESSLYLIESGQLMICVTRGSQVTPLAYLGPGEFLGELSFFDQMPRSANVIATMDSTVTQVPPAYALEHFPRWTLTLARFMTKKIRHLDELIRKKGMKKNNSKQVRSLSAQEQGHYFRILKSARSE